MTGNQPHFKTCQTKKEKYNKRGITCTHGLAEWYKHRSTSEKQKNATVMMLDQLYHNKMRTVLNDLVYRKSIQQIREEYHLPPKEVEDSGWHCKEVLTTWHVAAQNIWCTEDPYRDMPLRPIVNCILSPKYGLAKYLAELLKPLVGNSIHHIRNSETFIQKLKKIQLQEKALLVSISVTSLFTRVPLEDTLQVLSSTFQWRSRT